MEHKIANCRQVKLMPKIMRKGISCPVVHNTPPCRADYESGLHLFFKVHDAVAHRKEDRRRERLGEEVRKVVS